MVNIDKYVLGEPMFYKCHIMRALILITLVVLSCLDRSSITIRWFILTGAQSYCGSVLLWLSLTVAQSYCGSVLL